MNARTLIILTALILPLSLKAQVTFERTYGDGGAYAVTQAADGGYFIVGYTGGSGNFDVYVIATDQHGRELWAQLFGGDQDDCGYGVATFRDGGVLAAGWIVTGSSADIALHSNMANGGQRWIRVYGGSQDDIAYSVARDSDGGFVVAGETYSFGSGTPNVYVLRIDSLGDTLWTRTYGGANEDYARSVHQTSDSGFIICGTTYSYGAGLADVYLIKTNASGDTLWTRTYGGTHSDLGWSVRPTMDNGYIITGSTNSFGSASSDVYVVKTDVNGDTVWTRTFGGAGGDMGCSVQQTGDSGYIIAGAFGTGGYDAFLTRLDRDGDTLWTRTFGGTGDDYGHAVQQTADGGYILAGRLGTSGNSIWLVKTDAAGNVAITEPRACPTDRQGPSLTCEPNPCCGATTISPKPQASSSKPLTLRVFDSGGRMVLSQTVRASSFTLHPASLPSGVYLVRLDASGQSATTRLVVQR